MFFPCKEKVTLKVPLKSRKTSSGYEIAKLEVVDPLTLVAYLWNDVGIQVTQNEVQEYWRHHRNFSAPWALHSPAPDTTMPLGVYGDSVKVRSTYLGLEKMTGLFLNCPLYRPRSCRCGRWLLFACQDELLFGHHTLDVIYGYIVWALNHLFIGKYPTHGYQGAPLSLKGAQRAGQWVCRDRWIFQVTEIRGDWSWHKAVFRFKSSWKGGARHPVCFKCRAFAVGEADQLYYNVEENSPCWQTEYQTVECFIADQCPDQPCPLAEMSRFR